MVTGNMIHSNSRINLGQPVYPSVLKNPHLSAFTGCIFHEFSPNPAQPSTTKVKHINSHHPTGVTILPQTRVELILFMRKHLEKYLFGKQFHILLKFSEHRLMSRYLTWINFRADKISRIREFLAFSRN